MAKKTTRRPNLPQETLARARQEMYGAAADEAAPAPAPAEAQPLTSPVVQRPRRTTGVPSKSAHPRPVDLRQEYAYVVHDLQTMALLAVTLMFVLVLLSFFI